MFRDTAVVSGAASGIGLALTEALIARDFHVIAIDVEPGRLSELNRACSFERVDVRDEQALRKLASREDRPIKYVFANAGVGVPGAVLTGPLERWDWAFQVNVMGVIHLARAFWPHLRRRQGAFIATVSAAALQSYPGATLYRATKSALLSVLESLYYESQHSGVRVHALCPGMVQSCIAEVSRYADFRTDESDTSQPDPFSAIVHEAMKSAEHARDFAERVVDALPSLPPFYWFTHPETMAWIEGRHAAIRNGKAPFSPFGRAP